jgi:peptide deformylase
MTELYPETNGLQLVPPSSELLSRVVDPVATSEIKSDELQAAIDELLDIARGEQGNPARRTMVGLAAPQVGLNKRIIVVGIDADSMGKAPDFKAYINPQITSRSPKTNTNREGCYSTGRVCGVVERADSVTVTALDRFGNASTETHDGYVSRIFQHEIDHLNGLRFPDRITKPDDLLWVELKDFGDFRVRWRDWPHKCSQETWEDVKHGKL